MRTRWPRRATARIIGVGQARRVHRVSCVWSIAAPGSPSTEESQNGGAGRQGITFDTGGISIKPAASMQPHDLRHGRGGPR